MTICLLILLAPLAVAELFAVSLIGLCIVLTIAEWWNNRTWYPGYRLRCEQERQNYLESRKHNGRVR